MGWVGLNFFWPTMVGWVKKSSEPNPTRPMHTPNKESQPKTPYLCHHCGASGHTCPNYYKWLATQQSNNMISSGNQNQFPSFFAPLGDLFKALMFLSNLNGFNSFPSPPDQRFAQNEGSSKVWNEKGSKWFNHFFSLSPYDYALLVCFAFLFLSQSSFMLCFV